MPRLPGSKALDHLVVLDLTRVRAGPTCCRILADFGADVIKIEPPDGVDPNEGMSGPRHGYDMQNLHRNKRFLSLNLKTKAGLAAFMRLVERADIVVENYRPDVKDRLGIGYEALKAVNPRIILASVSGFGQSGPYATHPGFDQIAQGMGGLMWITGEAGQGPMRAGAAIADSSAGIYSAVGIFVALEERAKSGLGQWVHTSLLEAQIAICDFQAARYSVDKQVPAQAGNDHPYATPMGVLPTADGYVNVGVAGDGQWRAFCRAIGDADLAVTPAYATMEARYQARPQLMARFAALFRTKPSAHWIAALQVEGVPVGPIYKMDEMFEDEQVRHLGVAVPVRHPVRGEIDVLRQPVTLSRTPQEMVRAIAEKGEDSEVVLGEFGFTTREIAELKSAGAV